MRILIISYLFVTLAACTVHFKVHDGPVPPPEVDHIRGAIHGLGFGLLGGVAAGAAIFSTAKDCPKDEAELDCTIGVGVGGVVVGSLTVIAGAVIGGIAGSTGIYEPAPDWVPTLKATATPGGGSAAASWSF
jgi:hypothetical protein